MCIIILYNYTTIDMATNPSPSYCVMKKRDPFPMNERDLNFSNIVIFSNKYKNLKIHKCYSMALMCTFDIL